MAFRPIRTVCMLALAVHLSLPAAVVAGGLNTTDGSSVRSYQFLDQFGIGPRLRKCSTYAEQDVERCIKIREEMITLIKDLFISRQENTVEFIRRYLNMHFNRLIECLSTTCDGMFVLSSGREEVDVQWETLLAFQACIHAAPATWPADSDKSTSFAALYRLQAALRGKVEDCDPSELSSESVSILKKLNFQGQY